MQSMADRYAYLSFIGLFIMVCWVRRSRASPKDVTPLAMRAMASSMLLALSVVTYRQIGYWRDNVTLWTHALRVTDRNWLAENISHAR